MLEKSKPASPSEGIALIRLRLYVAGASPNSVLAIANLRAVCSERFASRFKLEVVDLLESPEKAARDGIVVTPTLLKVSPPPAQKLIGNLNDQQQVFVTLSAE